jgi:hypothetical protein
MEAKFDTDLNETGVQIVNWIHVEPDRALVIAVMNLQILQNSGKFVCD